MYNLLFVLLQLSILGSNGQPMTGTKLYVENAASKETVAFVQVGQSGQFEFSNLDPGNYFLLMEIKDYTVKKVDKKNRQKFDTDIEIAYNKDKNAYCWQRSDGFMKVDVSKKTKIADMLLPFFEPETVAVKQQNQDSDIPHTGEEKDFAEELTDQNETIEGKIKILQFTVINAYGSLSGDVSSITQKEFHKLVVGNNDVTLEEAGDVEVLKRLED